MSKAVLKSKLNYQDQQYGDGVEYTFFSEEIGEYKTKKKNDDEKYQWLASLPIGNCVDLVKNIKGKGYYINQLEEQETSEEIYNSMENNQNKTSNKPQRTTTTYNMESVDRLIANANYIRSKVDTAFFSSEDVRTMAISAFIKDK